MVPQTSLPQGFWRPALTGHDGCVVFPFQERVIFEAIPACIVHQPIPPALENMKLCLCPDEFAILLRRWSSSISPVLRSTE